MMLGGAEEIGANCTYVSIEGTGVFIDTGLHPRERTAAAFPAVDLLGHRPTDMAFITHAHTDHLGALPYVMRRFPHLRAIMTHATRDLSHITLPNGARLLKNEITPDVPREHLEFFDRNAIAQLRYAFEALAYGDELEFRGYSGRAGITASFHWAGHILGSAGVLLKSGGFSILHTGDTMFDNQTVIPKARLPRHHVDVLIMEATNGAVEHSPSRREERVRLARFINSITERNGSVLIPCFALGKMQEMVVMLGSMMQRGEIPHMPLHTGGMGTRISKVYDAYCYSDPMIHPGLEVSDTPQEPIIRDEIHRGPYLKTPSIVLVSSGMLNTGTLSYNLAQIWMTRANFGIAFIGYQHPSTPGYALSMSERKQPFDLAGRRVTRRCEVERFRFSAHASRESLIEFATDIRPSTLVLMHGEPEACDSLADDLHDRLPGMRILIPRQGVPYTLSSGTHDQ